MSEDRPARRRFINLTFMTLVDHDDSYFEVWPNLVNTGTHGIAHYIHRELAQRLN